MGFDTLHILLCNIIADGVADIEQVVGQTTLTATFQLGPQLFSKMPALAALFDSVRFKSFNVTYAPAQGSLQAGQVLAYWDYRGDDPVTTFQEGGDMQDVCFSQVFTPFSCPYKVQYREETDEFVPTTSATFYKPPQQTNPPRFVLMMKALPPVTADTILGSFIIQSELEFVGRH